MPPAELDLTNEEREALETVVCHAMRASVDALSDLVLRTTHLGKPELEAVTWDDLTVGPPEPMVVVRVQYLSGVLGSNLLLLSPDDASRMASLMMGEEQPVAAPLDELRLSAISEAVNQMVGAAATALSELLERRIEISPPATLLRPLSPDAASLLPNGEPGLRLVRVTFPVDIEDDAVGAIETRVIQLFPGTFVRQLVGEYLSTKEAPSATAAPAAQPARDARPAAPAAPAPVSAAAPAGPTRKAAQEDATPWRAQALGEPLRPAAGVPEEDPDRISFDVLRRVTVPVTVRLGQASLSLYEVLGLTRGAVVPLDATEGQPVDVLVSGTLVARGEVVVVRERFGVRITELVRPDTAQGGA
ncbi:MAG: FliM/FliN family flagellar motor switch protein [Limnochordaceae bacterium]|nr:FliM/FliN family flagellar motor switch protein [Limnochordaceae bacterium]